MLNTKQRTRGEPQSGAQSVAVADLETESEFQNVRLLLHSKLQVDNDTATRHSAHTQHTPQRHTRSRTAHSLCDNSANNHSYKTRTPTSGQTS